MFEFDGDIVSIHPLLSLPHLVREVGVACFNEWSEIAIKDFGLKSADEFVADLEREMSVGNTIVLVAHTEKEELVGTVSLRHSSDMPNHIPELTPWLACLFVSEGRRNQGMGSRLVRYIHDIAFERGLPTVYTGRLSRHFLQTSWVDGKGANRILRVHGHRHAT